MTALRVLKDEEKLARCSQDDGALGYGKRDAIRLGYIMKNPLPLSYKGGFSTSGLLTFWAR